MSLDERERAVMRREAALAARGAANLNPMMVKNFPSCCPIVHHDIANDIPANNKNITRACVPCPPKTLHHMHASATYQCT